MFGLVRMKCKSKHRYTSFLRAFSQSMLMTTILQVICLSSPVRRGDTIAGCRILLTPDPTGFYLNPSDFILCFTAMQSQQINQWASQRDERSLEERIRKFSPVSLKSWFSLIARHDHDFPCLVRSPIKQSYRASLHQAHLPHLMQATSCPRARNGKPGHF
jgi:hypothetical protein